MERRMTHGLKALLLVVISQGALMAVEEPPFKVESKNAKYEIRSYPPTLVAETRIEAGFDDAGNRGFRILADYIFGNNQARTQVSKEAFTTQQAPSEKIAMTAPVTQVQSPLGFLVQFTMPVRFTLETLPKPNDGRVQLRQIPARRVAVIKYTGSWSEDHYQKNLQALLSGLKQDGVKVVGEPLFARFNSPFQLWFLRRNEIWVEVAP
jgi:effector-binding domain-containing protein